MGSRSSTLVGALVGSTSLTSRWTPTRTDLVFAGVKPPVSLSWRGRGLLFLCLGALIAPRVVYADWLGAPKLGIERHPLGVTVPLDEVFFNSHPQRGGRLVTTHVDCPMYGSRLGVGSQTRCLSQQWSGEATPVGPGTQPTKQPKNKRSEEHTSELQSREN